MRSPTLRDIPPPPPGKAGWPWTEESLQLPDTIPDPWTGLKAGGSPWPSISIVTPSYNQGQFIEETIRSVLLQGYPNLEYIIIDGGSTDNSVEIIRKYEPWLTYWISEPDQGQTYAIDKGINHATGIIVNWLNSDDFLLPGALQILASVYRNNDSKDCILCGNGIIVNEFSVIIEERITQPSKPEDHFINKLLPFSGGIQASWFFTIEAWRRINGINLELNYRMDTDLYIRFFDAGIPFIPVNYSIAAYRTHPLTKTRRGWRENMIYRKKFYNNKLLKLSLPEQYQYKKIFKREYYATYLRSISISDRFYERVLKIIFALFEYPRALLSLYQIKRCYLLLFCPPDDIKDK